MNHGPDDRLDALPAGTELHGYVIESVLGHGGFGIVYQARHNELDTLVAVKEYIPAELSVRINNSVAPRSESCAEVFDEGLKRFLDEARQLVRFRRHPCVVSCQDLFRSNGTAYLVMERVDGLPLSELLRLREKRGLPLTEAELLSMIVPLLEGLEAIHAEGVLHRDVKPANILIRRSNEQPVLIDFGAAKQVVAKQSRSFAPYTEGYAAIEQVGAGELGPWTDVYGLGAVMWRVVAGGNPPWEDPKWKDRNWSPPNPLKVEARVQAWAFRRSDPLPPAHAIGAGRYSEHVLDAIDSCLQLAEENRIKNCHELLGLLRREKSMAAANSPTKEIPTVSNYDPPVVVHRPIRRPILADSLAGAVAILFVVILAGVPILVLTEFCNSARDDGESVGRLVTREQELSSDARDPLPTELASPPAKITPKEKTARIDRHRLPSQRELAPAIFRIDTDPPEAIVTLLGEHPPYRPDMLLPVGDYSVVVSAPGYKSRKRTIQHGTVPSLVHVQLQRIPSAPDSKSVPSGGTRGGVFPRIGGATSPRLLSKVEPDYSEEARDAKLQGTVMLAVEVWEDGVAHNIRVVRSLGLGLDEKAVEAARKWRFLPGMKDGKPVRVAAQIHMSFRLLAREEKTPLEERDPPSTERESVPATFRVDTVPPGATVELLDGPQPYTPDMVLPVGDYRIWVSAPGYKSTSWTIPHGTDPSVVQVELQRIESVRDAKSVPSGSTSGEVFQIGGGVSSPTTLHTVAAQYSQEAREAEYEGTVVLAFEVWEDGRAYNIRVLRGLGMGLDEKAVEALLQWEFSPGQKDGKPVRVATKMEFSFELR